MLGVSWAICRCRLVRCRIEVRQVQLTDASGRQIQRHRRAQPAHTDDQYTALFEAQLALHIDLFQQDLPAVTQQLIIAQHLITHGRNVPN